MAYRMTGPAPELAIPPRTRWVNSKLRRSSGASFSSVDNDNHGGASLRDNSKTVIFDRPHTPKNNQQPGRFTGTSYGNYDNIANPSQQHMASPGDIPSETTPHSNMVSNPSIRTEQTFHANKCHR